MRSDAIVSAQLFRLPLALSLLGAAHLFFPDAVIDLRSAQCLVLLSSTRGRAAVAAGAATEWEEGSGEWQELRVPTRIGRTLVQPTIGSELPLAVAAWLVARTHGRPRPRFAAPSSQIGQRASVYCSGAPGALSSFFPVSTRVALAEAVHIHKQSMLPCCSAALPRCSNLFSSSKRKRKRKRTLFGRPCMLSRPSSFHLAVGLCESVCV